MIWFEVFHRYALRLGFTWSEEFARYIMIWAALSRSRSAPTGASTSASSSSPTCSPARPPVLRLVLDLIGLAFFLFLTFTASA